MTCNWAFFKLPVMSLTKSLRFVHSLASVSPNNKNVNVHSQYFRAELFPLTDIIWTGILSFDSDVSPLFPKEILELWIHNKSVIKLLYQQILQIISNLSHVSLCSSALTVVRNLRKHMCSETGDTDMYTRTLVLKHW